MVEAPRHLRDSAVRNRLVGRHSSRKGTGAARAWRERTFGVGSSELDVGKQDLVQPASTGIQNTC